MNISNESKGVQKLFLLYLSKQIKEDISITLESVIVMNDKTALDDILRFSELLPVNVYIIYFDRNYPVSTIPKNVTFVQLGNDGTLPYRYGQKDKNCITIYCSGESHNIDFWDYNKQAWLRGRIEPRQSIIIYK